MNKARIYVETSVISYASARDNLPVLLAARQASSLFLLAAHDRFDLVVSHLVKDECKAGDVDASKRRLQCLVGLQNLESSQTQRLDVESIAQQLLTLKAFPEKAYIDAAHIALACVHEVPLIASWNFKHIASPWARNRIETALRSMGLTPPLIATPDELLEGVHDV
jgi:hypothetical protein